MEERNTRNEAANLALRMHSPTMMRDLDAAHRAGLITFAGEWEQDAERIARAFHEVYVELSPDFGWKPQPGTETRWDAIHAENRALMIATVQRLFADGVFVRRPVEE